MSLRPAGSTSLGSPFSATQKVDTSQDLHFEDGDIEAQGGGELCLRDTPGSGGSRIQT